MKKLFVLLLSLALVLGLFVACNQEPAPTTQNTPPTTTVMPTTPTTAEPTAPTTPPEPQFEEVVSSPDFLAAMAAAGGEKAKLAEDLTLGKFTFAAGCYFESSNTSYFTDGNINTQKKPITIVLSGTVNSIQFSARGASSGSDCVLTLYQAGAEEPIFTSEPISNGTFVEGIEIRDLEPGTYILESSASARIGNFCLTERLEVAAPAGLEASTVNDKFLVGRQLTAEGLTVELLYGNGRRDVLSAADYTTDLDQVEQKPGKHTVTVTHTATGFQDTYEIVIYAVDSIKLSDHSLDSSRITHAVQTIYLQGSSYNNFDHIAVVATCSAPDVAGEEIFVLRPGEFTFDEATDIDRRVSATVDAKLQNPLIGGVVQSSIPVAVIAVSDNVCKTHIVVDQNGTVGVGPDGIITVKKVNDALKLFALLGAPADARKTITLCQGVYFEKVDIAIPNLSMVAQAGVEAKDIVIVYDALNGLMDPSGTTSYATDGSATFSLRAEATGFYGKGFSIWNYYNTHAHYEYSKQIAGAGTQAVACLVRADQVIFEDMRFSSYHDTLYAENGRHIYRDCYIEGRTDYIFGNNATCYFTGCTIRSLGAGVHEKNGGYVIATKGGKDGQSVEYGYIFDDCTFEGDKNVQPGSVSIARGWGEYMTVMVMNCRLDGSFSKEAYGDTASPLNDRYTKMNADPVAAQLFEYNNSGDGALTKALIASAENGVIPGLCTVPSAQRAKDFADFSKIFAAQNGTFFYSDSWDGQLSL